MKYILTGRQLKLLTEQLNSDASIEEIQRYLISKGHDLGEFGPLGDGVDGTMGKLTKKAYEIEFGRKYEGEDVGETEIGESDYDAVLVGGLDNRSGDLQIGAQVNLLKSGLGANKNVKGFRYNTPTSEILEFMRQNPKIPIYLFSAGCVKASELVQDKNVNTSKLYIIEPYAKSEKTKGIVRAAVSSGVPVSNVFVGKNASRGEGVVSGASSSEASSHWDALKQVASKTM